MSNLTTEISTECDVSLPDSSDLSSDDISYGDEVLPSFPEETLSSSPETKEDFCLNSSLSSNLEDQSIIRSVLASDNLKAPSPSVSSMLELINLPSESDSFSFKPLYEDAKIEMAVFAFEPKGGMRP